MLILCATAAISLDPVARSRMISSNCDDSDVAATRVRDGLAGADCSPVAVLPPDAPARVPSISFRIAFNICQPNDLQTGLPEKVHESRRPVFNTMCSVAFNANVVGHDEPNIPFIVPTSLAGYELSGPLRTNTLSALRRPLFRLRCLLESLLQIDAQLRKSAATATRSNEDPERNIELFAAHGWASGNVEPPGSIDCYAEPDARCHDNFRVRD